MCPSNPKAWVNADPSGADTETAFRSYGGQNSYGVNQYAMRSHSGSSIAAFPETANTLAMVDASYYNVLPKDPCVLKGDPTNLNVTSSTYPKYWKHLGNSFAFRFKNGSADEPSDAEAMQLGKARHLETLNVLYLDGHVKSLGYSKVAIDVDLKPNSTSSLWDPFKQGCV
jgi:prepilin-type processing-associated H-X9-DG protein